MRWSGPLVRSEACNVMKCIFSVSHAWLATFLTNWSDLSRSDGDDSVNDFLRLLNHADWAVVSVGRL